MKCASPLLVERFISTLTVLLMFYIISQKANHSILHYYILDCMQNVQDDCRCIGTSCVSNKRNDGIEFDLYR